jgi:hypothetical protein
MKRFPVFFREISLIPKNTSEVILEEQEAKTRIPLFAVKDAPK